MRHPAPWLSLILALVGPPLAAADEPPRARPVVELRPARSDPAEGFVKKTIARSADTVYVQDRPGWTLDPADVAGARPEEDERKKPAIAVRFTPRGARIMGELSESLVNRRLAILVDGKVISAPTVRSRVTSAALIDGLSSWDEAETIARSLQDDR